MTNGFSVLIPSWNNLPYLQFLIASIRRNSFFEHEIIVHVQDGSDGTLEWVRANNILHTHSPENVGICTGFNMAATLATKDWMCMMDDDLYCFPQWDKAIHDFYVENEMPELSWLSGCLVESRPSSFSSFIIRNYGPDLETFDAELAIEHLESFKHQQHYNHNGTMPLVVSRAVFEKVGGYDTDFDPSPGSEEGFCMRLYQLGCRNFVSIKDCVAYHFGSLTNRRPNNMIKKDSNRTFMGKYGMVIREFSELINKDGLWAKADNVDPDEKAV